MDQVDAVLDRLAAELDARDARIADLSSRLSAGGTAADVEVEPVAASTRFVTQEPATETWEQPR